jgi:hypothetical protein
LLDCCCCRFLLRGGCGVARARQIAASSTTLVSVGFLVTLVGVFIRSLALFEALSTSPVVWTIVPSGDFILMCVARCVLHDAGRSSDIVVWRQGRRG